MPTNDELREWIDWMLDWAHITGKPVDVDALSAFRSLLDREDERQRPIEEGGDEIEELIKFLESYQHKPQFWPADAETFERIFAILRNRCASPHSSALAAYTKAVDFSVTCLREVWESVPGTYDEHDPMVIRHAAALTAIPTALSAVESARAKLGKEGKS